MCGISGILSSSRQPDPSWKDAVVAMRDRMAHRGPDGAGLLERPGCVLGHRRLAVVDLSAEAAQPMVSADGRFAIVYNGELYNDAELRADLTRMGVRFRTQSDTETVLAAFGVFGEHAFDKLRGMFALCAVDLERRVAWLARDPLGIKPLYFAEAQRDGSPELVFASEIAAMLQHPLIEPTPDRLGIVSYLTTSRTSFAERTLIEGVKLLEPGAVMRVRFAPGELRVTRRSLWDSFTARISADVGAVVEESVRLHLRSDVPLCTLLSGGLDSSIIATVAKKQLGGKDLMSFAAGAKGASAPGQDDFAFARHMAEHAGTTHTEAVVTQELFESRWREIVERTLLPLSTPNEVAINEVARTLRARGCIVTLSGEGADELFGGYDLALLAAAQFRDGTHAIQQRLADPHALTPGEFEMLANAWLTPESYHEAFAPEFLEGVDHGVAVREDFVREFTRCEEAAAMLGHHDPLQSHLIFQRRTNLASLLLRLDSAAMLEGVEGRTPFADVVVAGLAERLPMHRKFVARTDGQRRVQDTKVALREAFGPRLPGAIVTREKASFPLPFQNWIGAARRAALESEALRAVYRPEIIEAVCAGPSRLWHLAWPMLNLALWFEAMEAHDRARRSARASQPERT
jgi:asparagine synthase (glutamine-hydrolysing)